jgi:WD40 repeat protein
MSSPKPNTELLLSVLEYLDRNGYKESFDILLNDTGIRYLENIRRTIDELLKQKKIDELLIYINSCDKLSSEEKNNLMKFLKIRKFIELVYNNCSDRIDQKEALQFLRNEITPIIEDKELLNTLTKILFFKDMPTLKNFIQKNLAIYEDDKYILNQICEVKIAPLEQLYNVYNQNLVKKFGINFDKYNVCSLKNNEIYCNDNKGNNNIIINNIKIMEISRNKEFMAIAFVDLNISVFNIVKTRKDNLDIININFFSNINIKNNNNLDENKSNEINSMIFSYDEKHLLILINKSIINIYDIKTSKLLYKYDEIKEINNALYISPKNDILFFTKDKIMHSEENFKSPELSETDNISNKNDIQQILFSDFFNLIILIPDSIRDIKCINLQQKKFEFNIEIKEDIFSANISQTDGGKYLIINLSKNYPKILLYDLIERKFGQKYYGHIQKNFNSLCSFGGKTDQYILCASEDFLIYLWDRNISGLPKYQFKGHEQRIIGLSMINSSLILSCEENEIKIWTSYDIDDVNFNKEHNDKNKLMEIENIKEIKS